jgi:hypothetical protein
MPKSKATPKRTKIPKPCILRQPFTMAQFNRYVRCRKETQLWNKIKQAALWELTMEYARNGSINLVHRYNIRRF